MKKLISVFILLCLALTFASCTGTAVDVPKGMQLASGEDVSYNLFVPGGWITTSENGICGAYYSSGDKSNITMSSFYPEGDMESIADYWEKCKASYAETYKNFRLEEEEANVIIGERSAFKYTFSADIDSKSYKFMQIITVYDNLFYTLTYTAEADKYDAHLSDIEKVISEFEFK
ncbi:MAG: hypothetical protein U0M06_04000 [Clostridia bacterium]|nr:hypothetical protein [Clostridia bacterium]